MRTRGRDDDGAVADPSGDTLVRLLTDPDRRTVAARFPCPSYDVDLPGLYAWFVDEAGAAELALELDRPLPAGLIYAGQAGAGTSSATLRSRVRGNHLGGNVGGSTFRLTLASILASRLGLSRGPGRALAGDGEAILSSWMRGHLRWRSPWCPTGVASPPWRRTSSPGSTRHSTSRAWPAAPFGMRSLTSAAVAARWYVPRCLLERRPPDPSVPRPCCRTPMLPR